MPRDVWDHVAREIWSNEAKVILHLYESTDVSDCTYLLVYCRYMHAVDLKKELLMCKSLQTTSEVADDQDEMNNFYQQNKLVESRWLAVH